MRISQSLHLHRHKIRHAISLDESPLCIVLLFSVWLRDKVGWDGPASVLWDGTSSFFIWLRKNRTDPFFVWLRYNKSGMSCWHMGPTYQFFFFFFLLPYLHRPQPHRDRGPAHAQHSVPLPSSCLLALGPPTRSTSRRRHRPHPSLASPPMRRASCHWHR